MKRRIENLLVILLMLLACVAVLAWLHSRSTGYQRTWSDAKRQSCGRFVSIQGRIIWQRCELASPVYLPESLLKWKLSMPGDFVVGSNPDGERVIIDCGGMAIPFALPEPGRIIGVETRFGLSTDGAKMTRWSARWSERVISYWLILVLLLLIPAVVALRRLVKRIKLGKGRQLDVPIQHLSFGHEAGLAITPA